MQPKYKEKAQLEIIVLCFHNFTAQFQVPKKNPCVDIYL